MQPKVSIIISAYNSGFYIKPTIQSCLDQNYDNYNILILDDNSHDNTVDIIKEFNDEKIILFEWEINRGPYRWLNFLMQQTDADYIVIQDHDDIFHPDKLKETVNFLENNKDHIACGNDTFVFFEWQEQWYIYTADKWKHVMHTSLVFRNIWLRYRDKQDFYLEDLFFQKNILAKHGKIGNIPISLNLHLIKQWNKNLSAKWNTLTCSSVSKFFSLYWFNLYGIKVFATIVLKSLFPGAYKQRKISLIDHTYWIIKTDQAIPNNYIARLVVWVKK